MKKFKKIKNFGIILIFAVILFANLTAKAQTFEPAPSTSISIIAPANDMVFLNIDLLNISSSDLILKWQLLENNLPEQWDNSLCDYNTCFIGIPDSNTMQPVDSDKKAFLKITSRADGHPGEGMVKILVWDKNQPEHIDTLEYNIVFEETSSITENQKNSIRLYPNPVDDFLIITPIAGQNISQIKVYNILGQEQDLNVTYNSSVIRADFSNLSAGVYMVKIITTEGTITKKLNKK